MFCKGRDVGVRLVYRTRRVVNGGGGDWVGSCQVSSTGQETLTK